MRYDAERQAFVGEDFVFPVKFFINESYTYDHDFALRHHDGIALTQETRVVRGYFENRWGLSIIWGSMTYSVNHNHPWGTNWCSEDHERIYPPFVEEPSTVEVGIIMPVEKVRPGYKIELPGWTGPDEFPEQTYELWGDPLGYVDEPQLRWLSGVVASFDSDGEPEPTEGPYIETADDGTYCLNVGCEGGEEAT